MGTAIYQQAQAQQANDQSASPNGSTGTPEDDEVVEAEIVDEGESETPREGGAR
jgi:hypothetical protein